MKTNWKLENYCLLFCLIAMTLWSHLKFVVVILIIPQCYYKIMKVSRVMVMVCSVIVFSSLRIRYLVDLSVDQEHCINV